MPLWCRPIIGLFHRENEDGITKTSALSGLKIYSVSHHNLGEGSPLYGWKMEKEAVMAPHREVYEDLKKKTKQLEGTSLFINSSVCPSTMHSTLFSHSDKFQPGTLMSFL
jgi:hypothetical protein